MKKAHTVRSFVAGILITLLVVSMVPTALAAAGMSIYIYPGINVYIDDQKLDPKDAKGNPVMVFTYNGTTYLPVRAIGEALGKNVSWDGSTNSVYVGKHGDTQPTTWLNTKEYFNTDGSSWSFDEKRKDNLGNEHTGCMRINYGSTYGRQGSISYALNGQYRRLTGVCFQRYDYRHRLDVMAFEVYGDDRLLERIEIGPNVFPVNIDIDVAGVQVLQIKAVNVYVKDGNPTEVGCISELGLWT